jgi:hypothetical protein
MKTRIILFSFMLFLLAFACNTDDEKTFDQNDQAVFQGEESLESLFDAIESVTFSALNYADANSGGRKTILDDPEIACAEIGWSGNAEAGRIEIDFGTGCEGPDGKIRSGIIVVEYSGQWLEPGATITTVTNNFFVDDLKVEGTRVLENISVSMNELKYSVVLTGGKITWPDETFITRATERVHTITFGDNFEDYELEVEGTASGITRLGAIYEAATVEPLVFKSSCRGAIYLPVQGVKTINVPGRREITVNYGTGDCDNSFTVSVGEYSSVVMLNQ